MAITDYSIRQWAIDVLRGLGNSNPTERQIDFLAGWAGLEGGGYAPVQGVPSFNPINTSQYEPGSTCQNCAINYHVQNYPNYQSGINAIVANLTGPSHLYDNIARCLATGVCDYNAMQTEVNNFVCGPGDPGCVAYDRKWGHHYTIWDILNKGGGYQYTIEPGYRPGSAYTPTPTPTPPVIKTTPSIKPSNLRHVPGQTGPHRPGSVIVAQQQGNVSREPTFPTNISRAKKTTVQNFLSNIPVLNKLPPVTTGPAKRGPASSKSPSSTINTNAPGGAKDVTNKKPPVTVKGRSGLR